MASITRYIARTLFTANASAALMLGTPAFAADMNQISGSVDLEHRSFFSDPIDSRQHNNTSSIAATLEFYRSWNDQNDSLTITPFARFDQHDKERSHIGIIPVV